MEIYLDMLILENFIMNYIILFVTNKFSKANTNALRISISALIGALYAIIVFFPNLKLFYTLIFKICLSFVLIIIAFYPKNLKDLLKELAIFYMVSFAFGGAAFGLFYFSNFGVVISNGIFYISNFPIKILVISTILAYLIIKYSLTYIQKRIHKEDIIIAFDVSYKEITINLNGIIDTANTLFDPLTKNPVIVVEYYAIKEILPQQLRYIFENYKENDLNEVLQIVSDTEWISRFRLIPYTSLGKENGMLIGFRPDKVIVHEKEQLSIKNDIIVGIYNKNLSKHNSYNALLHPDIVNSL